MKLSETELTKHMIRILKDARESLPQDTWKRIWACINDSLNRHTFENGEVKQKVASNLFSFLGQYSPIGKANFSIYSRRGWFYCYEKEGGIDAPKNMAFYKTNTIKYTQKVRKTIMDTAIRTLERQLEYYETT